MKQNHNLVPGASHLPALAPGGGKMKDPWNEVEKINEAVRKRIDQFRYIKIQPKTIDLSTRLWGITKEFGVYSPEPRTEVYCVRLNFNISKVVY